MADFMFYQPTRIDFGAGKLERQERSLHLTATVVCLSLPQIRKMYCGLYMTG